MTWSGVLLRAPEGAAIDDLPKDWEPSAIGTPEAVRGVFEEEFPGLGHDAAVQTVDSISRDVLSRATIEDFVPVLVHRFAREQILDAR